MNRPQHPKAIENIRRFKRPPTVEQINDVIRKMKVPAIHFERFSGIPEGTIYTIRTSPRNLAPQYWHHIYEPEQDKQPPTFSPTVEFTTKAPKNRRKTYDKDISKLK